MRPVIAALLIGLTTNTVALAQYTFDAKGRSYDCAPYDWGCTILPPPGAPLQPLPEQLRQRPTAICCKPCDQKHNPLGAS